MAQKITKILLVDDDQFFSELMSDILTKYQTKIATDAIMAMRLIDEFCPDVIVLDLLMPAVTGFGLLNEIMSYTDLRQIPIIVCSSVADKVDADFLAASGVVAILDKNNFHPDDLRMAIKRLEI
ncbi:MAG: response regulator [Candidatus Saccharibacteria bacterium]|nr:response regulator [Candidatus Saccharibacteria bacterium]